MKVWRRILWILLAQCPAAASTARIIGERGSEQQDEKKTEGRTKRANPAAGKRSFKDESDLIIFPTRKK